MGLAVYADRSARNLAAPIGHSAIKVQRYTDGLFVFILVMFALDQNVGSIHGLPRRYHDGVYANV
jgi:hypothetical protein